MQNSLSASNQLVSFMYDDRVKISLVVCLESSSRPVRAILEFSILIFDLNNVHACAHCADNFGQAVMLPYIPQLFSDTVLEVCMLRSGGSAAALPCYSTSQARKQAAAESMSAHHLTPRDGSSREPHWTSAVGNKV